MASFILYVVALFDTLEEEACAQKLSSEFQAYLVSSKSLGNSRDCKSLYIQRRKVRKAGEASIKHLPFLPATQGCFQETSQKQELSCTQEEFLGLK